MKNLLTPSLVLGLIGCSSTGTPSLTQFKNCDEMSSYLRNSIERQIALATENESENNPSQQKTSNENADTPLEEGDFIKAEDGLLVGQKESEVQIFNISDPSGMQQIGSIQLAVGSQVDELILKNKILLVITGSDRSTRITSYDLSQPANPEKLKEIELTATYGQARISAKGDRAVLVLNSSNQASINQYWAMKFNSYSITDVNFSDLTNKLLAEKRQDGSTSTLCDCKDVSYVPDLIDPRQTAMTHIVSISLNRQSIVKQEMSFLGSPPVLRATTDAFLFAIPAYKSMTDMEASETHLILAQDEGKIEAKAETRTDGFLKEQFNLSLIGDYVYAFTSLVKKSDYIYSSFVPSETVLKTFRIRGNKLELTNTSKGIGQNEFLFSSLFTPKRAYAVTFKKTDPFYVFDLSDGPVPRILGELKIEGHSRQLRDAGDNRILAIGRDAQDTGQGFALYQGVQVSVFETDSSGQPSLADRIIFGNRETRSDAAGSGYWGIGDESYKSYVYDENAHLLLLPTSFNAWAIGNEVSAEHTVQVFEVGAELNHLPQLSGFTSYVDRIVPLESAYLAVSNGEIVSFSKELPIKMIQNLPR